MNNKIIIAVVAVVVVGGGAWYFLSRGGGVVTPGGVVLPGQKITNPKTIGELFALGQPLKCAVTPTSENGGMSGTYYVANKKMRTDFSNTMSDKVYSGHMIMDDKVAYSWMDGQATGFKMAVSDEEGAEGAGDESVDMNEEIGFSCEVWNVDPAVFELPANVKFSDPMGASGATVPAAPVNGSAGANVNAGGGVSGNAAQCAACDQVPAEYRSQCRASLGCN